MEFSVELKLLTLFGPGEGKGYPLQYSCLENPQTEELGGLQSMWSQRVGHDWATKHNTPFWYCWYWESYQYQEILNLFSINIFFINIIASFVFQKSINSLDASKCIVYFEFLFLHHF